MHSGVFAISPNAAADVVAGLAQGSLVGRIEREVRDYVPASNDTPPSDIRSLPPSAMASFGCRKPGAICNR